MTSPLEDFSAAVSAMSKSAAFLNRVCDLTAPSHEIARTYDEDGDTVFLLNGTNGRKPSSRHLALQIAQERDRADEEAVKAFTALRALCPAFDTASFSAEILIGKPSTRHPRIHLRMFGRPLTNAEHPVELPRTLAALELPARELASLGKSSGRLFRVETQTRYPKPIPAQSPEDALRIHASLVFPDLLENFKSFVKISEVLNAVSITKAMLAARKPGEMAET